MPDSNFLPGECVINVKANEVVRFAHFTLCYERLASKGKADVPGSSEFRRVWVEYRIAGYPCPVGPFIQRCANTPPDADLDMRGITSSPAVEDLDADDCFIPSKAAIVHGEEPTPRRDPPYTEGSHDAK